MEGPPGGFKASQNEKQGLLANGTWDETDIRPKSEILAMAKSSGKKIHIGSLMVIVSIKVFFLKSRQMNGLSKLELCFGETLSGMRKIKRQWSMTLQPQLLPVLVGSTC